MLGIYENTLVETFKFRQKFGGRRTPGLPPNRLFASISNENIVDVDDVGSEPKSNMPNGMARLLSIVKTDKN